jgi:hypothetical protein
VSWLGELVGGLVEVVGEVCFGGEVGGGGDEGVDAVPVV